MRDNDGSYNPKWPYWIHLVFVFTGLIIAFLVFTPLREHFKANFIFCSIKAPSSTYGSGLQYS